MIVRLPNRIKVEAYFHPRDTIETVEDWLRSEVFNDIARDVTFDLYTSPPKTVVAFGIELIQLRFVPSAIVHLSWHQSELTAKIGGSSENITMALLREDLFNAASDYRGLQSENTRMLPAGYKLVEDIASGQNNLADGKSVSNVASSDDLKHSRDKPKSGKPSWMKL